MKQLPDNVVCYQRTPDFDEHTVPAGLLRRHSTKAGVWGRIVVTEGELVYRILAPPVEEMVLSAARFGVVEPQCEHEVQPSGRVRFHVEFLRASPVDGA